jgi:hypothetical protein
VVQEYFEVVYGPLIGPTSLFLARTLARHLAAAGGPVTVSPIQLSLEVGLRSSRTDPLGKGSHLAKALDRLGHHHLVRPLGTETLGVVTAVPALNAKLLARLPESTRRRHTQLLDAADDP